MPNICFMGAGSGFVESLATDVFQMNGVDGGTFWLVDIDAKRLEISYRFAQMINEKFGSKWTIKATTERREALPGSDYIINCIEVSGLDTVRHDNDIPLKYGISQCIGDTIGPGGMFKLLRTAPVWVDVLRDCEELCPNALMLNYTNPMSMMCLVAARCSSIKTLGLCHSVQHTSRGLAKYADVPYEELDFNCVGINHMAWFTKLEHQGKDLYPVLRDKIADRGETWEKDPVRFDLMEHLGAFVTESSGHLSEYLPYYRKRPDLLKEYTREGYRGEEGYYVNIWPTWRSGADERRLKILNGESEEELKLERSAEYASYIIEAIETNTPAVIYGNVPNTGLITNLPQSGIVEVPCMLDGNGVHPTHYGELPSQLAGLCSSNMSVYELGAQAILNRDKEAVVHALMLDPLTAAVCCPAEIRKMTYEMFEAEKEYLHGFH